MSLRDAFLGQARSCIALDSPFIGQLLEILAHNWPDDTPFARLCRDWPGDITPAGASLPLRIAIGLHALVLTGRDSDLAAVYPPHRANDAALKETVLDSLTTHQDFLTDWVQSPLKPMKSGAVSL